MEVSISCSGKCRLTWRIRLPSHLPPLCPCDLGLCDSAGIYTPGPITEVDGEGNDKVTPIMDTTALADLDHACGRHVGHQVRDDLLERGVRNARAGVLEGEPEGRVPVSLALHHADLRVRAGD